ncbi:MAG: hypothetical protein TYPL_1900 [Candidatus Tyloplasma litorale]|nr:MAG: hypothetical protein TYPL_1900 [Mycoplasmatales bacterium]
MNIENNIALNNIPLSGNDNKAKAKAKLNVAINIEKLVERVMGIGEYNKTLVLPEYQRDYLWNEKNDIPSLLTSLYKGFPIGFITIWDDYFNDRHYLIDGLQRHFSLLKIYQKKYSYLHFDIFEYWLMKNEKIENWEEERSEWKENFRHFRSFLHHKRNDYKAKTKEQILDWIKSTSRFSEKESEKELYIDFINHYDNWFEKEFKNIIIPHIILKEFNVDEVTKIFEITNTKGKTLNKFEIVSANWYKNKIILNEKIDFIENFQLTRKQKYKNSFLDLEENERISDNFIKYDDKEIIPSNFIYAIFYETIKNKQEVYNSFYKDNAVLRPNAIEAISEVVKEALIKEYHLEDEEIDIESLGYWLSKKIKTKNDVDNILSIISKAVDYIIQEIKLLSFSKGNGKANKNLSHSSWIISTFIIHVIRDVKNNPKGNFSKWFIYDSLIKEEYKSSTGNNARKFIQENKYGKNFNDETGKTDDQLCEEMIYLLNNQKVNSKRDSISYGIKLILAIAQSNNYTPSTSYDLDHLLPYSFGNKINKEDVNINSIYNLQYLPSYQNNEKSNKIEENQIKWDVFKRDIENSEMFLDYDNSWKRIVNNIKLKEYIEFNDFESMTNIRKKIIENNILSKEWIK